MYKCGVCHRDVGHITKHHTTPQVKGGKNGEVILCCNDCHTHIHSLFTESELMYLQHKEVIESDGMQKFIKWIRKNPGNVKVKMSNRVKRKKRR